MAGRRNSPGGELVGPNSRTVSGGCVQREGRLAEAEQQIQCDNDFSLYTRLFRILDPENLSSQQVLHRVITIDVAGYDVVRAQKDP